LQLRSPNPDDHAAIREVVRAAFDKSRFDEAGVIDGVRAENAIAVELVAVEGDEVLGHVLFSRMTCDPSAFIVGLGPVAVSPAHQNKGIGEALCRIGLAACADLGAAGAVVLGHPTYYPRFGFSREAALPLRSPFSDLPAFMAMPLVSGGLDGVVEVAYPAAFG